MVEATNKTEYKPNIRGLQIP